MPDGLADLLTCQAAHEVAHGDNTHGFVSMDHQEVTEVAFCHLLHGLLE